MEYKDYNEVTWIVKPPTIANPEQLTDWLSPLAEMRGYALYENGQRPYFKIGDNQFLDNDSFDQYSYHILVKLDKKIIGCVRLLPLKPELDCVTSQIIGKETLRNILNNFFENTHGLAEASRWIVHPDYRHTSIGYNLVYALWALAKALNYKFIANSGQYSQKLINHYGAVYIMDQTKPFFSEQYQDHIYIFYFDERKLTSAAIANIQKMQDILKLKQSYTAHAQ